MSLIYFLVGGDRKEFFIFFDFESFNIEFRVEWFFLLEEWFFLWFVFLVVF